MVAPERLTRTNRDFYCPSLNTQFIYCSCSSVSHRVSVCRCLTAVAEFQNMFLQFIRVVFLLGVIYSFASSVSLSNNTQDLLLVKKKKREREKEENPGNSFSFPTRLHSPMESHLKLVKMLLHKLKLSRLN